MLAPRILFVLPVSGGGGGANSVVQESIGLRRLGVPASIALNSETSARFAAGYPELHQARVPLLSFDSPAALATLASAADVVCATTNASVKIVKDALDLIKGAPKPRAAYYVQDYEPLFYTPKSPEWDEAYRSFTLIPECALFAKTQWLCDMVYANHGARVTKVEPSIDHDIYYPDLSRTRDKLTISAMLRPQTPRRAPFRTVRILEALAQRHAGKINLQVFGSTDAALKDFGIRLSPQILNHGSLRRTEVPNVLRNSDLFLDLSDFQAFGRTGLEAMASGCVALVPSLGGSSEYLVDGVNGYSVDTRSDEQILATVDRFVGLTASSRGDVKLAALETAAQFSVSKAAISELQVFRTIAGGSR